MTEITYALTREDFWRFNRFWMLRTSVGRRALLLSGVLPVLLTPLLVAALTTGNPLRLNAGLSLITLIASGVATYWTTKWNTYRTFQRLPDHFKNATLRLGPTALRTSNLSVATDLAWDAVTDVTQDEHNLYLFLSERQGLIVPRRVFGDPTQATAFFETARRLWFEAKQPLPAR